MYDWIKGTVEYVALLIFFLFLIAFVFEDLSKRYINMEIFGWVALGFVGVYLVTRFGAPLWKTYTRLRRRGVLVRVNSVLRWIFFASIAYFAVVVLVDNLWVDISGLHFGISLSVTIALAFLTWVLPKPKGHVVISLRRSWQMLSEAKRLGAYVNQVFSVLLIIYLLALLVEEFREGFITDIVNLTYLLVIVIIAGVLSVLLPQQEKAPKRATRWDYLFVAALGVAGAILIFIKTRDLGWLAYGISIIAGLLIVLMGALILQEEPAGAKSL